jgi:hypothetical protein
MTHRFGFIGRSGLFAVIICAALSACSGDESPQVENSAERVVLDVAAENDQVVLLPTSVLAFRLQNTDRIEADSAVVNFAGFHSASGKFIKTYSARLDRVGDVGDILVELPVADGFWADVIAEGSAPTDELSYEGTIEIKLSDALGVSVRARLTGVHLEFVQKLAPQVETIEVGEVFPGQKIAVEGAGFLRPSEGTTWAEIDSGAVQYPDGSSRDIAGLKIPLDWAGTRERAYFRIDPAVFGVQVATFSARLRLLNRLSDGTVWAGSENLVIAGALKQSYIAALSPEAGSRGQKITITGRGFVPTSAEFGYGMLLRYEGTFTPTGSETGRETTILRAPDRIIDEETAEQSVWYAIDEGRTLSGLGATPGVFVGTITPELFDRWGEQKGVAWEGKFEVRPTRQVVYLKYLPSFSTGLEKYGLRNVEYEIRRRILEVVERDFAGINVEFREQPPEDFIDFAVVELGGPDPSGHNAFGYDNTFNGVAKDTGNLYLADYLGGLNAQSGREFNNPYGGIFLESFSFFSLELNPHNPHASAEFDRIMRPFMPALGGTPVRGTEWPDGPRRAAIAQAIHMVGSVLGNTVSHELGHSLGLTFVPEDELEPTQIFHNIDYGPYIMDPGAERPFEERAEINGAGPAFFSERNYNYLQKYLPRIE